MKDEQLLQVLQGLQVSLAHHLVDFHVGSFQDLEEEELKMNESEEKMKSKWRLILSSTVKSKFWKIGSLVNLIFCRFHETALSPSDEKSRIKLPSRLCFKN